MVCSRCVDPAAFRENERVRGPGSGADGALVAKPIDERRGGHAVAAVPLPELALGVAAPRKDIALMVNGNGVPVAAAQGHDAARRQITTPGPAAVTSELQREKVLLLSRHAHMVSGRARRTRRHLDSLNQQPARQLAPLAKRLPRARRGWKCPTRTPTSPAAVCVVEGEASLVLS